MNIDCIPTVLQRCDLYVDHEARALICRRCKCALAPTNSQVTTHLDKKHGVSKELRKGLTRCLREHPWSFIHPSSIPTRSSGSEPHPELRIHEGFACRKCDYCTVSSKQIISHLAVSHLHARASKPRTDDLYDDVFLQTWSDGPLRSYWIVCVDGATVRPLYQLHAAAHL
jgi:putative component of membrane protein insertase Oxa1/YidC/SpoIIIJ protein YidD